MTAKINTILEINNTLNGIVNKRKETQAQIVNYTNQIIDLEKQLANAKSANTATLEIENKIGALQTLVQACHVNNTNNVYDIDSLTTTEQNEKFDNLVNSFTSGVEIFNAKDNSKVAVALQDQEYIKCVHQGLAITTANNNKIIIYPNITLAQNANNNFYIVPTSDFKFTFYTKPEATKQASQDVNQVKENEIGVFIDAIYDEKFLVQDGAKYLTLQEAIDNYLTLLKTIEGPALVGIKKTYFENIVVFGNDFSAFLNTLKTDITFTNIVLQSPAFKDILNANESKAIESMALIDLLQCFTNLAEISNENSNETFSLLYLIAKQQGIQITQYQDVPNLNSADVKAYCKQLIAVAQTQLQKSATQNNFVLAQLLKSYNPAFYTQYISHLYKYASIVIKADGKVTRPEEDGLKKLFESNNGEENFKPTQIQNTTNPEKTLEQLIYELYDLTGLQPVKAEINNLISLIK